MPNIVPAVCVVEVPYVTYRVYAPGGMVAEVGSLWEAHGWGLAECPAGYVVREVRGWARV